MARDGVIAPVGDDESGYEAKRMNVWSLTTYAGDGPRIFLAEDNIDVATEVARQWLMKVLEMDEAAFAERYESGLYKGWYHVEPLFGAGVVDVEAMNETEYRVVLHVAKI